MDSSAPSDSPLGLPAREEVREVRRRLLRWWRDHGREFWWRSEQDPYEIAVVEILLKQTRASSVDGALRDFVRQYPSAGALVQEPEGKLIEALLPFGLQRQRAAHLKHLGAAVVERPEVLWGTTPELLTLPGLGPYAATAVSVFAHGRRETVIDVNVVRIFSRLWGITTPRGELRKSREIAAVARSYSATTRPREANWALLDLGGTVCLSKAPHCQECPLSSGCAHAEAGAQPVTAPNEPES